MAEAKKASEKAKKQAKKQAVTKKTMTDEEQRKEMKGLAVEPGMMGPPTTTHVAVAKKSGKGKGKDGVKAPKAAARARDVGRPTIVTGMGPSSLDLSPNLATVSALVGGMDEEAALASVLEVLPGPDLGVAMPGRAPLLASTSVTSLAASTSSTSVPSTASEGQAGRRKKGSAVKRAMGFELEGKGNVADWAMLPKASAGSKRPKRKDATPPRVTREFHCPHNKSKVS